MSYLLSGTQTRIPRPSAYTQTAVSLPLASYEDSSDTFDHADRAASCSDALLGFKASASPFQLSTDNSAPVIRCSTPLSEELNSTAQSEWYIAHVYYERVQSAEVNVIFICSYRDPHDTTFHMSTIAESTDSDE